MGRTLTGPGSVAKSGDTMLGAFNEAKGADIASATSVNLVIATGNLIDITGNTTIVSMNLAPGAERVLRFTGTLTLTNSASLVLPGGANIVTTPGDFAVVRGYPNGIVRCVTYTRASGNVQRLGDSMLGTLTYAAGTNAAPPVKYQIGTLTSVPVNNSTEWDGTNVYQTTSAGVRKKLLYTDGSAANLTGFTAAQITTALNFTPFNPTLSSAQLCPPGALLEMGRYLDFHSINSTNDYDVRFDCKAPSGGYGSSVLDISATYVSVNGIELASTSSPMFTGRVGLPRGTSAMPGLYFIGEAGTGSGLYQDRDAMLGVAVTGSPSIEFTGGGVLVKRAGTNCGHISLEKPADSTALTGNISISGSGNKITISDEGSGKGAYIDLSSVLANAGSRILTSDQTTASIGGSGWQKLPSGLIMQWGKVADSGVTSVYTTFPITFPNACVSFITSYDMTNQRGSYGSGGSVSTSGAYVFTDGCSSWWLALGY